MKGQKQRTCYLCGKEFLHAEVESADHVPPKQFFPKQFRTQLDKLITLPTHEKCNKSYEADEVYFVNSLGPAAVDSFVGAHLWKDILASLRRPRAKKFLRALTKEFSKTTPSGLLIPGLVLKSMDSGRIGRVVWKIARGLFFQETRRFLPETTPLNIEFTAPGTEPPGHFAWLDGAPNRGVYPGALDYRFRVFSEVHNLNLWAFLFWDRIIFTTLFHDPDCCCNICRPEAGTMGRIHDEAKTSERQADIR